VSCAVLASRCHFQQTFDAASRADVAIASLVDRGPERRGIGAEPSDSLPENAARPQFPYRQSRRFRETRSPKVPTLCTRHGRLSHQSPATAQRNMKVENQRIVSRRMRKPAWTPCPGPLTAAPGKTSSNRVPDHDLPVGLLPLAGFILKKPTRITLIRYRLSPRAAGVAPITGSGQQVSLPRGDQI